MSWWPTSLKCFVSGQPDRLRQAGESPVKAAAQRASNRHNTELKSKGWMQKSDGEVLYIEFCWCNELIHVSIEI